MKKIAIVGVEGSGKTVLMAAMGEKYRKPRADGLFLYANSRKTIEYCNEQIDILRNQHKWPSSTSPDSLVNLEWTLMRRKKGSRPEEVCTVAFLDFAGEIYRYAFGDSTDDFDRIKQSQYKKQIEAVKSHLKDAESVVVLVNLSDIINSNGVSTKASEMDWLSQRIFDFAFDETSTNRVAIAFTQKDLYEETIGRCGGLEGTFEAYLPSVYYRHESEIVPFAVSAVNKTVPNDKGEPLPASDFDSEGFDELISWMADVSGVQVDHMRKPADTKNEGYGSGTYGSDVSKTDVSKTKETQKFLTACRGGHYDDAAKIIGLIDKDNPNVLFHLGQMYAHGFGVAKDFMEATKWYRKAAELGDCRAQNNLGTIYENGQGVVEDYVEAIKWYRIAAEKGNADAQYNLGFMYDNGWGVAKDDAEAMRWYRKAAANGVSDAQSRLYALENSGRAEARQENTHKHCDDSFKWKWYHVVAFSIATWVLIRIILSICESMIQR